MCSRPATGWQVIQTGDFNGDGKSDLVWQHTDGSTVAVAHERAHVDESRSRAGAGERLDGLFRSGDFNDDGKSDLVWRHTDGSTGLWLMDGLTWTSHAVVLGPATGWSLVP